MQALQPTPQREGRPAARRGRRRTIGQLTADARRLQQVLWNLVHNAMKFTPASGRVELRVQRQDGAVQITVQDTGQGIAAGVPAARVRAVPAGGFVLDARVLRARPRAFHRQAAGRAARRDDRSLERRRGARCHLRDSSSSGTAATRPNGSEGINIRVGLRH